MVKKKGKGKPQGAQDEASSSTGPPQPAPPQSSQGDAPQKQGAIKKQPSDQPTQHELSPQQAPQQSKKKGGKKGKQEDVTSQSQAGPEQKRDVGQPQQIGQQAQISQPQYQQMPQGFHPQYPSQQQPPFSPQHQPPVMQWGQQPQQQAWGQQQQAPQHLQQQQIHMPQAPMYQLPPQMGQQPPQAWGQQQPQMGQPQRGQPQYPPQQQAQVTPPQYQPQQQVQGRGRPQQGQPHPQQQQQGGRGRGRGRPQQGQHPQQQAPFPQQQAPFPQQQAPFPQQQAPFPQQQAPFPQHQAQSPQHQAQSPQHQAQSPQHHAQSPQHQAQPQQQQAQPPQQAQQAPQKGPQQQPQKGPQQQQGGRGRPQQGQPPQTQQQGAKASASTQQLAKLQVSDLPPMRFAQVKPGTLGRKILVETNHLQLTLGKLRSAIHYDVNLVPDTPKKYLRQVVELFRLKHFPRRYPAFDGRKNLYSTTRLPFDDFISDEIVLQEPDGRDRKYKVEIKFANEVDLTPLHDFDLSKDTPREALQVVDIVLRSAPAVNLISVGRSFFSKPEGILDLGEGMEMYNGFYQSAIRGWKPFLNVDVAHKAFPKNLNVTDAMIELFDSYFQRFERKDLMNNLNPTQIKTFEKYIKTLRVTYEIPGNSASRRSYRVNGIDQAPRDKKFKMDNGRELTIENYFTNEKRYRLKYPHLPTLWVGDRNRPNPILLPLELCTIEHSQVTNRKMTENQTSKMIKFAATNTEIRKQKITTALRQANHNQNQTVREFGFSIANEFEKLQARILQPPTLGYNNQLQDKPSKGVWRGNKFFHGVEINKWTIACADRRGARPDDIGRLADMIFKTSGQCGMQIRQPPEKPFITMGNQLNDIKKFFQNQKDKGYDVIFVIVPNSGKEYSFVKSAAEINTGCLTQCLKMRTLGKLNPQTVTNILLKVNAKLNGTNHFLLTRPPIMNRPCMIMGADVTHPSPDSQDIPSVAAVTASHDPKAFKYNICWRLQPPKVEIIEDLEAITLEQLRYFYDQNKGMKPERIVFFRDGVSEGQFDQVRQAEIRAIRSACKKMQASDYEPKITFLVVQKRHHTRLFPTNPRDSEDRNMNVPAGTCVDTTITHPFLQDFYLVSHASIQGVAKPTKYCTLWDDNDMTNDDIEALTYHLCHMFTRCNRSVSYPAPTYYAHLAAARAKVYIENDRIDLNNLQREYARYPIQDVIRKGRPMFFV